MEDKIGSKVEVWSGDGNKLIGEGTLEGQVMVYVFYLQTHDLLTAENCEVVPPVEVIEQWLKQGAVLRAVNTVKIKMNDGKITYGCKVWWRLIDEPIKQRNHPPA